jgi:hypothetical protein
MPSPLKETAAMRRQILSLLSESDTLTVAAATALVAGEWSRRRQRLGLSPASARTSSALAFHVGADLSADLAGVSPVLDAPC